MFTRRQCRLRSRECHKVERLVLVTRVASRPLVGRGIGRLSDHNSQTLASGRPGSSTARAKGAIGRLDFHFTLVLSARAEPECAARGFNNRAAGAFIWIIHKLVEPNLRRRSNTQVALVMKLQAGLARASGFNRFIGMNTAASRKSASDTARRFRCDRASRPDPGLGVSDR